MYILARYRVMALAHSCIVANRNCWILWARPRYCAFVMMAHCLFGFELPEFSTSPGEEHDSPGSDRCATGRDPQSLVVEVATECFRV